MSNLISVILNKFLPIRTNNLNFSNNVLKTLDDLYIFILLHPIFQGIPAQYMHTQLDTTFHKIYLMTLYL